MILTYIPFSKHLSIFRSGFQSNIWYKHGSAERGRMIMEISVVYKRDHIVIAQAAFYRHVFAREAFIEKRRI